jgi:thymidylate kinase
MPGKRPFRVAVVGIDGVGKTLVAGKLADHELLRGKRVAVFSPFFKSSGARSRWVGGMLERLMRKSPRGSQRVAWATGGLLHTAAYPLARVPAEKGMDITIYDRHPLIEIEARARAFGKGSTLRLLKKPLSILSATPEPDLVVHVVADPRTCMARIRLRAAREKSKLDPHEKLLQLRKLHIALSKVVKNAEGAGKPVVRVYTDDANYDEKGNVVWLTGYSKVRAAARALMREYATFKRA